MGAEIFIIRMSSSLACISVTVKRVIVLQGLTSVRAAIRLQFYYSGGKKRVEQKCPVCQGL